MRKLRGVFCRVSGPPFPPGAGGGGALWYHGATFDDSADIGRMILVP